MNIEKMISDIKNFTPPYGYQMNVREMDIILDTASGNAFYSAVYAFHYGFMKGQRAAEARKRAKAG